MVEMFLIMCKEVNLAPDYRCRSCRCWDKLRLQERSCGTCPGVDRYKEAYIVGEQSTLDRGDSMTGPETGPTF